MDISTLSLPVRKDRSHKGLFGVRPSFTSVNVSYETAEGNHSYSNDISGSPQDSYASNPVLGTVGDLHEQRSLKTSYDSRHDGTAPIIPSSPSRSPSNPSLVSPQSSKSQSSVSNSPSPTHEFPAKIQTYSSDKQNNSSDANISITPTKSNSSSSRHSRARSSFSIASAECQLFVASLKEPKYEKPLSADEIAWIFQDFYLKLRAELLGPADELLTKDEQEHHRQLEGDIDIVLDKAERAVTGGELFSKLFTLGGTHDLLLQPRINAIREHDELLDSLVLKLGIDKNEVKEEELTVAVNYLNRLNKETSPKAKLVALTKAHLCIVEAIPKSNGDADSIFPLFVLCLTKSTAVDWWQNFMFIQRFRRASELVGQAAYCLTNLEAAIHVLEQFTVNSVPEGVDPTVLNKQITNPRSRQRSSSQSSKGSSSNSAAATSSFSQRLGETLSSYRSMLVAARRPQYQPQSIVDQRFLNADPDSLTLADVKILLKEYKRLAEFVESRKSPSFSTVSDAKLI